MRNLKKIVFILIFLSAILLSIPFMLPHCGWVSLFAFVPLFAAQTIAENNKLRFFFLYYYAGFIIWNAITTFFIWFATPAGAIAAILLNALQMSIIFWLFTKMKKFTKGFLPYLFLIVTWLAWEHAYANWEISWIWLTLGNSFATSLRSIQWYEFTGALGGSLWILLCNSLLYRIITLKLENKPIKLSASSLALLYIVPLCISIFLWNSRKEENQNLSGSRNFLVIQPNIDPYNDKFENLTQNAQDDIFFNLYYKNISSDTYLTLAPETFVNPTHTNPILIENFPEKNVSFFRFMKTLNEVNDSLKCKSSIIFGAVTDLYYPEYNETAPTETARPITPGMWFDRFNTAVFIGGNNKVNFYHKSKLVILVESTPFRRFLKFLKKFEIDLGGMIGSFGKSKEAYVFTMPDKTKVGTAICYESIYGDYYREYVLNGANVMTIITNDGWWKDTPGYKQHLSFASLRAIETRRSIARCANTGISAFINQRGEITERTKWWQECAIKGSLNLNDKITVFVRFGDIIGRVSNFIFILLLLMMISRALSKKYIHYKN